MADDDRSVSGQELIERLRAAGGVLRVDQPSAATRRRYRRAVHAARESGVIPPGARIRYSGRDRGDLVIRLVPASEVPRPEKPPLVAVPSTPLAELPAELRGIASSLRTSEAVRPRALRILRALADEASRRGHRVEPDENDASLAVVIGPDRFALTLFEEDDLVDTVPEDELATKRYPWQRVTLRPTRVPSGRLKLELRVGYQKRSWADRQRWRLEDRLGHTFAHLESAAREADDRRRAARQRAEELRDAWNAAMADALDRHVAALNRQRIYDQLDRWAKAERLRDFADAIATLVAAEVDPEKEAQMAAWEQLIREEAARTDPIVSTIDLRIIEPDSVNPADLEPYMPRGMSAFRPPIVPG